MARVVDFVTVSTAGLESSPVADALAGLRANEARYFKNKYDHVFTVEPASDAQAAIDWVHRILKEERDIVIASPPLEATDFEVENIRWPEVFYENGLAINVLYTLDNRKSQDFTADRTRLHEAVERFAPGFRTVGIPRSQEDALAAGGVRFANAFCTTSLCSPSRASSRSSS